MASLRRSHPPAGPGPDRCDRRRSPRQNGPPLAEDHDAIRHPAHRLHRGSEAGCSQPAVSGPMYLASLPGSHTTGAGSPPQRAHGWRKPRKKPRGRQRMSARVEDQMAAPMGRNVVVAGEIVVEFPSLQEVPRVSWGQPCRCGQPGPRLPVEAQDLGDEAMGKRGLSRLRRRANRVSRL